jgi:hypothetical protein
MSQSAMSSGLNDEELDELESLVTELERVVRRRRYAETD